MTTREREQLLQSQNKMKVITGFIYYFLLSIMALTLSLSVFAFRPLRKLLHKIQTKYNKILNNTFFNYLIYFSFAIIGIILAESIYSFIKMHAHILLHEELLSEKQLQNFDIVRGHHSQNVEDTILTMKQYKEYYISERNIMLTSSAFLAYFIFNRIFFNIRKLADEEYKIENPGQKGLFEAEMPSEDDSKKKKAA